VKLTISLLASRGETLSSLSILLEIDVPALGLTSLVFQGESEDGGTLLDGIFPLGIVGLEGVVDKIKGSGGRECV
jgi:hypothetical protein